MRNIRRINYHVDSTIDNRINPRPMYNVFVGGKMMSNSERRNTFSWVEVQQIREAIEPTLTADEIKSNHFTIQAINVR